MTKTWKLTLTGIDNGGDDYTIRLENDGTPNAIVTLVRLALSAVADEMNVE